MSTPRSSRTPILRRRLAAAWLLTAALLVPGFAGAQPPKEPSAVLRAASEYDYPPFSIVTEHGQADGFSVELLRAVLKAMGREATFQVGPWHALKQELAEGRLDVLPVVARTAARDEVYDFSVPYLTMHGTIVVRREDAQRIKGLEDLRGREVAVMHGDIAEDYVRDLAVTDRIVTTTTVEQAMKELAAGSHDAVVVQTLVARTQIRRLRLNNLETVGPPLDEYQDFCFAVREHDHETLAVLNEGLALVIADGTYQRLREKWLAPLNEDKPSYLPLIGVALATLLVAWLTAFLWQGSLRRMVRARTAELTAVNAALALEAAQRLRTAQALQRKSEELEAMFSNTHVQIAILDREFRVVRANAAYAATLGRAPEDLVGRSHFALFRHAAHLATFQHVVASGLSHSACAVPMEQQERTTYQDWTLHPIMDGSGRVEGVLLSLIDATERELQRQAAQAAWQQAQQQLERRVRERTLELEEANRELESFSYSVSHDLRGPLRAINGFSAMLEEECVDLSAESRACLDRIRGATLRMSELIDGLLNLAQVFRRDIQPVPVDLGALAQELLAQIRAADPNRPVEMDVDCGQVVTGDPLLLRVLLQNLLGNAWKFTARRAPARIEFGCRQRKHGPVFYVRDNGAGFDMRYAHKLFQPFERLHDTDEYEGTGIGLATVRRIVRRHGGAVWAEAAPDAGATIFFTLNEAASQADGDEAPSANEDVTPSERETRSGAG